MSFIVSAPGKVIIFGEHAAVYGKPAIAAALSLRCYLLVAPSKNSRVIRLRFPDIDLDHSWNIDEIPWREIRQYIQYENGRPKVPNELVPEIIDNLSFLLSNFPNKVHYYACFCFLYLYCSLCDENIPGMEFTVKSTLPIGAGLGSSACTSVCLSTALSLLGGWIERPSVLKDEMVLKRDIPDLEFIDSWSLMGEKCFHGNPSGVDNAVATHGGAVMFQRNSKPSLPSVRTNIRNFPSIKLLLTNTKVPKSTADLVEGVGKLNQRYSGITQPIFESIENITKEAYSIMTIPNFGSEEVEVLKKLVGINHGLLVGLGVSHPSLEKVKMICDEFQIGATKLTGAGGGGCAITLVNEATPEETIQKVIEKYKQEGFECFETSLGGKGVGVLFDREDLFDHFNLYKDRSQIEDGLNLDHVNEWKFW